MGLEVTINSLEELCDLMCNNSIPRHNDEKSDVQMIEDKEVANNNNKHSSN